MKTKILMILFLSTPLLSFSSPLENDPAFVKHKEQLNQDLNEKRKALSSCHAECRKQYQNFDLWQCNSGMCSSQKIAFDKAQKELDEIAMSQSVVDNKEASLDGMKNQWQACTNRCLNKPNNQHSADHCRDVICKDLKDQYEGYKAQSESMDENNEKLEDGKTAENPEGNEAVVNQVREKRDKVGALAYVAAGTTAFLGYKAAKCCSATFCSSCPMYVGMTALAGAQTAKMFKKRDSLNETCRDLSTNGICNPISPDEVENPDNPIPPDPLPPGCEYAPEVCRGGDPSNPSPTIDPSEISQVTTPDYPTGSFAGGETLTPEMLGEIFKPKGGWPKGENPFKDSEEFDYDSLSADQKQEINDAMKGFNQRKKSYMAQNGLLDSGDSSGGLNSGSDDDKKGQGGLLAENEFDEVDLSSGFPQVKDGSGSLAGGSVNSGSRRRRVAGKEPNTIDKMKEMLKKMSGSDKNKGDLSDMSVSIGNDYVGVREDNIFLMVHRMNRKLDEQHRRFIIDF